MSMLKDLGQVSIETRTSAHNSIWSDSSVGDPFPGQPSPRFCNDGSMCVEIFVRHGVAKVDGNVFSVRSDCWDFILAKTVYCKFAP
jgi:hypothetical protein